MAGSNTPERLKDVLLEHVSRDVKKLQESQSNLEQMEDVVTLTNEFVQRLCEHLDKVLLHGLHSNDSGYWPVVSYFTRSEAIKIIHQLPAVKTNIGRGRAWLYLALSEQSMESYVRMFSENQDFIREYYLRDSFMRDLEKLVILETLMAGLDFITFDLPIESIYLDYGATKASSTLGTLQSSELTLTPDIEPTFLSAVSPSISPQTGGKAGVEGVSEKQTLPVIKGGVEEELVTSSEFSSSPHRTLTQTEPRGIGQAGFAESGSSSYSPSGHPGDMFRTATQQNAGGGAEEEESDIVQHKGKSGKGKTKKKKKKKKSKTAESAASHAASGVGNAKEQARVEEGGARVEGGVARVVADSGLVEVKEVIGQSAEMAAEKESAVVEDQNTSVVEVGGHKSIVESPDEFPWDQWTPSEGGTEQVSQEGGGAEQTSLEGGGAEQASLGDYMEECDVGLPQELHPLPLPQSTNKRLSLADELEMAIKSESMSPSPPPPDQTATLPTSHAHPGVVMPDDSTFVEQGAVNENTDDQNTPPNAKTTEPASTSDSSPLRPNEITEKDRMASDVELDDNTRLVISLISLETEEGSQDEDLLRLVQVATPTGVGQQKGSYVLITSQCTHILRKDGIEGHYSREISIRYRDFEHIVIGLGWQSLHFIYHSKGSKVEGSLKEYVILTGSEAVSRSITDAIRTAAAACPGFVQSIPLNKDDEARVDAIEKELIKLGSETSMDIMQYFLVNWEQLSGDEPTNIVQEGGGVSRSGLLHIKTVNLLGISTWRQSYFTVRDGELYQYSSEDDEIAKNVYQIRNCGGCMRASGEGKQFALSILGEDRSVMLVLAASNEEELTLWMQTLCEAVLEKEMPGSPTLRKTCFSCALLLTQNKLHVLQEDWINKSVQLVATCGVTEVNAVSVDKSLPLYCTISYDHGSEEGVWLICFSTEYELGKFEFALASMWREEFQIDLSFSNVMDKLTQQRAHKAVELMQGSKFRSDSVTRGRTEFTFSDRY